MSPLLSFIIMAPGFESRVRVFYGLTAGHGSQLIMKQSPNSSKLLLHLHVREVELGRVLSFSFASPQSTFLNFSRLIFHSSSVNLNVAFDKKIRDLIKIINEVAHIREKHFFTGGICH